MEIKEIFTSSSI